MIKQAQKHNITNISTLILDAIHNIANTLTGEDEKSKILETLDKYITMDTNRLSYKNIIVGIKSAVKVFGVHENDSIIFTLPLDYCYGIVCLLIHFHAGAKVLLTDKNILDKEFWDFFRIKTFTNSQF